MARLTHYSSVAAITGRRPSTSYSPGLVKPEYTLPVGILSVLIVLRHKDNIIYDLLRQKPEPKVRISENRDSTKLTSKEPKV